MAILNIKSLPDPLYRKLKARAKRNHRSVAQEVTVILEQAVLRDDSVSLMDLRGLGKDVWNAVDALAYVDEERSTWD